MVDDKYAVTGWAGKREFDLQLPSGQLCLVKPLDMVDIVKMGLIDKLDTFTGLLMGEKDDKESNAGVEIVKALGDPKKFANFEEVCDKVVVACVVKPAVDFKARDGVIGVESIDFMDKMRIFESVFTGMSSMSDFREGQTTGVASVENVSLPGSETE